MREDDPFGAGIDRNLGGLRGGEMPGHLGEVALLFSERGFNHQQVDVVGKFQCPLTAACVHHERHGSARTRFADLGKVNTATVH